MVEKEWKERVVLLTIINAGGSRYCSGILLDCRNEASVVVAVSSSHAGAEQICDITDSRRLACELQVKEFERLQLV